MNLVVTYKNPDTDGIACAIGVGMLFSYKPSYQGEIALETQYVLNRIGIETPEKVENFEIADNIILVDTHHRAQLGEDFPVDKVVMIIDHHPGGDDEWFINARIDNRQVGAAASIVGEMIMEEGVMSREICQLLEYAIVSNTLFFTAPSTTDYDRDIFKRLRELYPVSNQELKEMLKHRRSGSVTSDVKFFDFGGGRIAISQIEEYEPLFSSDSVKEELNRLNKANGLLFSIFNCVDMESKKSTVYFSDGITDEEACRYLGFNVNNGVSIVNRILLRKTDFIPSNWCPSRTTVNDTLKA